ncbi:MAG: maleylpyruvate isomerase family mycothiol-dependent enzyme [Actinomycetes bacterium]
MDVTEWLDALREDGTLLATAARQDLDAPVPTCPGWTVRDAVVHTAAVYGHKSAAVTLGRRPEPGEWPTEPASGEDPVAWFRARHAYLLDVLTTYDPDAVAWTWWPPDQTVRFWCRRMAQETAVHRVDVQSAFDDITPVGSALAADGVDELLSIFLVEESEEEVGGTGQRVTVRLGDRAWRSTLHPAGVELDDAIGPADAVVTGEPSELYLYLWGRRPESAVQVTGDVEAARALRGWLVTCTQ